MKKAILALALVLATVAVASSKQDGGDPPPDCAPGVPKCVYNAQ